MSLGHYVVHSGTLSTNFFFIFNFSQLNLFLVKHFIDINTPPLYKS